MIDICMKIKYDKISGVDCWHNWADENEISYK